MIENKTIALGEVSLKVNNLEKQTAFYQEVIGLHIIEESDKKVSLGIEESGEILVSLVPTTETKKVRFTTGLYHLALLLPTRKELGEVLRHLLEIKAPLVGGADHGYSEALYLNDPEGNGIEIYWDKPRSQWDIKEDGQIKGVTLEMDAEGILSLSNAPLRQMPQGTKMGHVHLTVAHHEENEAFYRDILGFTLTDDLGGYARFYAMDGYHHHIGTNNWLGEELARPTDNSLGINYYKINWLKEEAFYQMKENLLQKNYSLAEETSNEFKITDPNGIIIHMELKK